MFADDDYPDCASRRGRPEVRKGAELVKDLRAALMSCLSVQRWVDDIMLHEPFGSPYELRRAAHQAAVPSGAEVLEALADHPRIGEAPAAESRAADFSRAEQVAPDADDPIMVAAIAEGNRRYEARFGRIFLIRASGRSRSEILAELNRRLALDDDEDLDIAGSELRDIALARLDVLIAEGLL